METLDKTIHGAAIGCIAECDYMTDILDEDGAKILGLDTGSHGTNLVVESPEGAAIFSITDILRLAALLRHLPVVDGDITVIGEVEYGAEQQLLFGRRRVLPPPA